MTAIGIDLGGTKIEVQVFDNDWNVVDRRRRETPQDYDALVTAIITEIHWAEAQSTSGVPVGIGAPGLIDPDTGLALTANLPASGRPLPADIATALGRKITYLNDCRALALSEAVFGQGTGHRVIVALVLGTGVGGGVVVDGSVLQGATLAGGEFGHTSAPAHIIARHDLPIFECGCGRSGCIETYISGPGLSRLALALTGKQLTPPEIAARKDGDMAAVWALWCDLVADLVNNLTLTIDPDIIVIGGGLSNIDGMLDDLSEATLHAQIGDVGVARMVLAEGGDASGARGAAFAAFQVDRDD